MFGHKNLNSFAERNLLSTPIPSSYFHLQMEMAAQPFDHVGFSLLNTGPCNKKPKREHDELTLCAATSSLASTIGSISTSSIRHGCN